MVRPVSADASTDRSGIGVAGATAIGIGGMVGGGIFAVLGVAATRAGGATPVAFLVGGVVAALTAYSYARLSVAMTSAGGTVSFIDRVFGVSQVTGSVNALLWIGYVVTTALYAAAFGNYAGTFVGGDGEPGPVVLRTLIAVGVVVPWAVNLANASVVARAETFVVGIKMLILVIVVVAGAPSIDSARLAPSTWTGPLGIVGAGMLIFVAYEGFELISNASDDVRDPDRTLPRAFAASVGIVVVLYVAIATVVVGSLTPDRIVQAADFALAEAASDSLGQIGFRAVAVSAVLATLSALNATLYGAARLSYTLATERELPNEFANRKWDDPVGLHVTAGLGLLAAVTLPLASISAMASAIFLLVFAMVNAAAFRAADDIAARRPIAGAGAVACGLALIVLLVKTATDSPAAIVTLVVTSAFVLGVEHRLLAPRRDE
jgi:amino acid transporter